MYNFCNFTIFEIFAILQTLNTFYPVYILRGRAGRTKQNLHHTITPRIKDTYMCNWGYFVYDFAVSQITSYPHAFLARTFVGISIQM